jgi:hypothetical protein
MPAKTTTAAVLGGANPSPDEPESNRAMKDPAMTHAREIPPREIVFVDPGVADIETLLGHLRPAVEAILLDPVRPAARQMATALSGRHGLDAVHVIAHGAPGRVNFAAGGWSAETLAGEAEDLAAIGRVLDASGDLRLWSCQTAAGPAGAAFVAGLARASGADIAAATGRVGAAALGGGWELEPQSACNAVRPPLTDAGMAGYAGVLAVTLTSTGRGERLGIFGSWPVGTAAGTYFVVLNNNGQLEVIGKFIVPANVAGTFVVPADLPAGRYTIGSNDAGPATITVYNGKWRPGDRPEGTWSLGDFDPAISATLNYSRMPAQNLSGAI